MNVVRRWVTVNDETYLEAARSVDPHWERCAVAAVVRNPWRGRGFVSDLSSEVEEIAPDLVDGLVSRLVDALGGVERIAAFGKGAVVGLAGEIEHGAALIHTPHFGDHFRHYVDGTSVINFADQRSTAGTALVVPVWHKNHATTRSHYATVDVRVPDAPRPDEIVVIAAAAAGPRPFARIGDRATDGQSSYEKVVNSQ